MFWKEKQTKFSIRKFNLGVASVIIGMTGLLYTIPNEVFSAELPVLAQTNIAREQISYKYVLYSELTSDEKARIQAAIPARQVGNTHTYYMVYRPKVNLPQTGSTLPVASSFIGLGLLIIGLSLTKDRKKRLVRSLIILTATGSFSVAAISTGSLSGFDKQFTLAVGEVLPQAVISIDQHEFVGFILEGDVNSETVTVTEAFIDEQKSSGELALPNISAEPDSPVSPPTEATAPEQPEAVVSPSTPASEIQGDPVSPTQPVVPTKPEEVVAPIAPVSEAQGEPASPVSTVSEEVSPKQPVISSDPESPVSPNTETTAPEQPEEVVSPSTPASETQGEPASPVSPVSEEVSPDQPVISSDPESPVSPNTETTAPEQPEEIVPPSTPVSEEQGDPASPTQPVVQTKPEEAVSPSTLVSEAQGEPVSPTQPVVPTKQEEAVAPIATVSEIQGEPVSPVSEEASPEQPVVPVISAELDSPVSPPTEAPAPEQPEEVVSPSTPASETQGTPASPTQPVVPTKPEEVVAPIAPVLEEQGEPVSPTQPVVPTKPEEAVAPIAPVLEEQGEPVSPTQPVVPTKPEEAVAPIAPVSEEQGDPISPTQPVVPTKPEEAVSQITPVSPVSEEVAPEQPVVPVTLDEPDSPVSPPTEATAPEQPEAVVSPSTPASEIQGDPVSPTQPVVPTKPEEVVAPIAPVSEIQGEPASPTQPVVQTKPEEVVAPIAPVSEEQGAPVSPTQSVVPTKPEEAVSPSTPASEAQGYPASPNQPVVPTKPEVAVSPSTPVSETQGEPVSSTQSVVSAKPEEVVVPIAPVSEEQGEPASPVSPVSEEVSTDQPVISSDPESPVSPNTETPAPEQPEEAVSPSTPASEIPSEPASPVSPVSEEVSPDQPVISAEPDSPVSPNTETPAPEQPEEAVSPSTPASEIQGEPVSPTQPVVPTKSEEAVSPSTPTSETQGDPASPVSPVSEEVAPDQPVISAEPEIPVSPPTEATTPEQPEEVVSPSTPDSEIQGEPVSPTQPVVPTKPEESVAPIAPVSEEQGEPVSPVSEEVAPDQPVISDESESPVSPPTEATTPEQPEEVVAPSTPVSETQGEPASPVSPVSEEVAPDQPVISDEPASPVSPPAEATASEQPEEVAEPITPNLSAPETSTGPEVPVVPTVEEVLPTQPEEPAKIKPELDVAMLKENVDDKTVELSYTLTDTDSTFVQAVVSLHKGDELVTEIAIQAKDELDKVRFTELLLNTEYTVKTRFTYHLGSEDIEVVLPTEKFELENKLLELRDYKSIELYQVDESGEKTRVTALSNLPSSTENYLVKIATVNNKEIYLPVDNFENDVNGIKVSIIHPKLVKFNQNNHSFDEHHTFTVDRLVLQEGAYSKFSELVDAINTNPSGTYYLAADMVVDKSVSTDTYITKEFTGSLKSLGDHKTYSILQLDRPLFSTLKNARVENISLKDVAISNEQTEVAALAKKSDKSIIDKVSISGNITAKQNISGIVYNATNGTTISNSIVNVNLSNTASHESYHMGGVTGILNSSTIDKVRATVAIDAKTASGRGQGIGGIVANAQGAVIKNSYVTGNIHATETADTGGVVGLARMSFLNNIATGASVTNGGIIASGQNAYATVLSTISNLYSVEGQATGQPNPAIQSTSLSPEAVLEKIKAWGIPTTPTTTGQETTDSQSNSVQTIDYNQVQHAQAERRIAYENTAKLLPFYDRHTIVKYGNLIDETSNLYSKPIRSVLTLTEDGIVTNLYDQHASLNKLLIHFEDGTSEILPLVFKGEYGNTKVVEYRLGDQLLYTPEQLLSLESSLIDELVAAFSQVELYSEKMADILHIQTSDKQAKLKDLYLDESFAEVKANLEEHIKGLLANRQVVDTTSKAVRDVIKKEFLADKEKIMFALAYLNRLYGITYGDTNIKNIVLHHADFYSRQLDTLEWLKSFTDKIIKDTDVYYVSQNGYENMYFDRLTLANNAAIHKERFGHLSGQLGTVRDFLEYNKKLFLGETDSRKWFKEATNAFVYEIPSHANTSIDTSLYSHLGRIPRYEKYYLPLLNIKEKDDIFVLSSMATVAFGGYGRYVDTALKKTNPDQYYQHVQSVQTGLIPKHAKRLGDFLDMWYQMADSHLRDKFIQRSTEIWDGYWIKDSNAFEDQTDKRRWADKYDQEYRYVQKLAGALNEWHRKSTDSAFSDTETFVKFSNRDMLSDLGDSTMSHELIHNYDETIMLDGHKRRPGQDAESYAMGLLQSSAGGGIYYYGFNFMNEHSPNTPHNVSSSRFKTKEDLQTYLKGVFDVTYLLDAVEIQAIAAKGKESYPYFFNKIELVPVDEATVGQSLGYQNVHDRIRKLSNEELANLNIATINDAIDHALVAKTSLLPEQDYLRENLKNYYFLPLYYPIYAGLQNNQGTVGGLQFRKTALELLAAKGWEDGFIPYATDKLKAEAEAAGRPLSDQFIFEKLFTNHYTDYVSFKKAMYKERWDKKDRLRAITISFNGQTETIDNVETLSRLMAEAVDKDYQAAKNKQAGFNRQGLKDAILKAYVGLTDSFTSSIFTE